MANEVRLIHSAMPGAPVLAGQVGSLIALLDAALVNGFGVLAADSLVISGGVATVTRAGGVQRSIGDVLEIAGAVTTGGSVNGARKVLNVSGTTFTFDATGLPNQTATGAVTYKVAALGWTKTFTGANLAAYKANNVAATGALLRVDDTGTTAARVLGYEAMTDVSTGTGPFPTNAQVAGGGYWAKSQTADGVAREWVLWGDDRAFYLYVKYYTASGPYACTTFFGDVVPVKTPDPFAVALTCNSANYATNVSSGATDVSTQWYNDANSGTPAMYFPRSITGVGAAVGAGRAPHFGFNTSSQQSGAPGSHMLSYPNFGDNGLLIAPIHISGVNAGVFYMRGTMPGIYFCPQAIGISVFANRDEVTGVTGLPGRTLRALNNGYGVLFTDVTGPWR